MRHSYQLNLKIFYVSTTNVKQKFVMDFAKNLLEKYGWEEGQGLGKNSDGIAVPLKPNLKFDTVGLGHNKADEINNHWWSDMYNNAAKNLDVNKNESEGILGLKEKEFDEINKKNYLYRNTKDYSKTFLKCSTLTKAGKEIACSSKTSVITPAKIKLISDDELFLACNGRTAHKAARHGLTLSGKLSRIDQQEKEFLKTHLSASTIVSTETSSAIYDWTTNKHSKYKIRENRKIIIPQDADEDNNTKNIYQNESVYHSAKKRAKQRKLDETLSAALASCSTNDNPSTKLNKTKDMNLHELENSSKSIRKKNKHKKSKRTKNDMAKSKVTKEHKKKHKQLNDTELYESYRQSSNASTDDEKEKPRKTRLHHTNPLKIDYKNLSRFQKKHLKVEDLTNNVMVYKNGVFKNSICKSSTKKHKKKVKKLIKNLEKNLNLITL